MPDEPDDLPADLGAHLADLAVELDGVTATPAADGTTELRRGPIPFAVLAGLAAEFLLDRPIAAAATRTPDTSASSRGPGWIRFAPRTLDDHALDRAEAWLTNAWRHAGR